MQRLLAKTARTVGDIAPFGVLLFLMSPDPVALTTQLDYLAQTGVSGATELVTAGLRSLVGEVRALKVRSTALTEVPEWLGELTRLEALEISGEEWVWAPNVVLRTLPMSLRQLGALKQLTLQNLAALEALPHLPLHHRKCS